MKDAKLEGSLFPVNQGGTEQIKGNPHHTKNQTKPKQGTVVGKWRAGEVNALAGLYTMLELFYHG